MLGEMPARQESQNIADQRAQEDRCEGLPRYEHRLMGEEAGEDRGRFTLEETAGKYRHQAVLFDQCVDGLGHPG